MGRVARITALVAASLLGCLGATAAAPAAHGSTGGAAPERDGGAGYGAPTPPAPPVVRILRVDQGRVIAGRPARVRLRIRLPQASTLSDVRIVLLRRKGMEPVAQLPVTVSGNQTVTINVPTDAVSRSGRYVIRVHAKDQVGQVLRRTRQYPGKTVLKIRRPKPKPTPTPTPTPPTPTPTPTPVPPTPNPGTSPGGVFPVQGAYTLGGAGARFGATRAGHIHQGQDIVAAEGLPVVAPFGGTVTTTSFQAGGAGYYVVLDGSDGRSYFFAHCRAGSTAVTVGQTVAAGAQLCQVGSTGSSTGPHLHFEIWLGGWRRDKNSRPIDPLPDLLAWRG